MTEVLYYWPQNKVSPRSSFIVPREKKMPTKNFGPCSIIDCTNTDVKFRTITKLAYEKCRMKKTLEAYSYLENTFASSVNMLTKALYFQQHQECTGLELDPVNFERMIETINPGLKGFYNYLMNAIISKERSAYNISEAKKLVVRLCYLIAGLRNKFVNRYKLEVGLYLRASDVDLRHLPTAYSTAHPPRPELCDSCGRLLVNNNSTVFACGHGYHIDCYRGKCTHCEEFYKKGIFKNVRKFLTRIEKGEDKLTKKDIDDDENDVESQDEKSEDVKELDLSSKLIAEINQIENW
ncbi:hypothetical protein C2G38_2030492 [Gigaspora rosea]|uniref:Uncharacterized protein n=1 Tax=Gigaspora rosea TaxID=44941 RepID=A0A397VU52_9GLOM|nr:hypothetical protein C2G38_2030492 [Gigaspora rosea]